MSALDAWISAADVARLAGVTLATVSNWRRRHRDTFPNASRRHDQERFLTSEVVVWLDGRKIARNDLLDNELLGMTYGLRFRRNAGLRSNTAKIADILWDQVDNHRGPATPNTHSDLVLILQYLSARDRDLWARLVTAAEGQDLWRLSNLIGEALFAHGLSTPHFGQIPRGFGNADAAQYLANLVRVIDRIGRLLERDDFWRTPIVSADIFDDILYRFAEAEGKRGAEFHTPASVVGLMIELVSPKRGDHVLDPFCGPGTFLVETAKYLRRQGVDPREVFLAGQTPNERSWLQSKMRFELHDLTVELAPPSLALHENPYASRRFDAVLTNPPFNLAGWSQRQCADDSVWRYGRPPEHNANFAWLQHVVSCLEDGGRAVVVMPNGAASSENPAERSIRAAMVEDGVVASLVALPPRLFPATAVAVTLWLLRKPGRYRAGDLLLIDASKHGSDVTRTRRELTANSVGEIVGTYRAWQSGNAINIQGFARSVSLTEIRSNDYRLRPSSYIASEFGAGATADVLRQLRNELVHLHRKATEIDAAADRALRWIDSWTH